MECYVSLQCYCAILYISWYIPELTYENSDRNKFVAMTLLPHEFTNHVTCTGERINICNKELEYLWDCIWIKLVSLGFILLTLTWRVKWQISEISARTNMDHKHIKLTSTKGSNGLCIRSWYSMLKIGDLRSGWTAACHYQLRYQDKLKLCSIIAIMWQEPGHSVLVDRFWHKIEHSTLI
jgi:hypothetical protein